MARSLLCILFFASQFLGCRGIKPEPVKFEKAPYYFDVGGSNSKLAEGKISIIPELNYTSEFGYGITSNGGEDFYHEGVEQSRDEFLIDGIEAPEIGVKVDIPTGYWWVTVWMEFGMEDSLTTRFHLQGKEKDIQLQTFSEEAEERTQIEKTYRVINQKVFIGDNGLEFRLEGINDMVRLLGFSLIPEPVTSGDEVTSGIFDQLKEAGKYNSEIDLKPIIAELHELEQQSEYQVFASYWKQQVEFLKEGEKFFYYRGWSERTDETGLGLFDHIHQGIIMFDTILKSTNAESNPLYERALWYNARLLYWLWLEGASHHERDAAFTYLKEMLERHPDNELVRMYNGDKIDSPDPFDDAQKLDNAPEWSFAQWEMMNRLKYYADWWVNEQQSETGEFGGKFGDDVEILRWWSPLILSGDTTVYKGWRKLADGVFNSSKVYNGYAKKPSDVEHSSEFISDTAPLMVLYSDDQEYVNRLAYSADYFRNLWTGYNDNGERFFKSAWFSSTEIETEIPKNRDVAYNARAAKAVRYYAWKTKDDATQKALIEWADAWYTATQKTDKGKPVGLIPASIAFPSGEFNGDEKDWYTANMYWDYFDWSGATAILDQFLYTWTFTKNEKYLTPLIQHLELVNKFRESLSNPNNNFEKGSEGWAAYVLGNSSQFWNVIGTWRLLTGDESYDEIIIQHGTPFIKYRLTGDEDYLVEGIQPYLDYIRYNEPLITSEVIHTDRVHIKEGRVREAGILQAMVTGYGIAESSSPYVAVSWENASRDLTFLVTDSNPSILDIQIYSYSNKTESVTARIWQLEPGNYQVIQTEGGTTTKKEIEIQSFGERIELTIQPKVLTKIQVQKD